MTSVRILYPAACLFLLASACSKEPEKKLAAPPPAPAEEPATPTEQNEFPGKDPNRAAVTIDPKILELCNIPTPQFDFDSSALKPQAKEALDALTACFKDGPAKDRNLSFVGHADPRGTDEYNMALGQRRAASVSGYLENGGIASSRMETSSRGELDAVGTDEESWAKDRKVEIFMAE